MTPNEYQQKASETNQYIVKYDKQMSTTLLALGLNGEAGEVAEKVKKFYRDGISEVGLRDDLMKELGDVLWYLSQLAMLYNITLEDIMIANIEKLESRSKRNKINGDGDNR